MKLVFTLITLCSFVIDTNAFTPNGVHDADSVKKDSLRSGTGLVRITPYPLVQKPAALGFSYYGLNNQRIMKVYEGTSVFTTQYGQVPNLSSYPYYNAVPGGTLRSGSSPLMVVDGIPFSSNLASLTTLNTFDYSDITVLSGLNAAAGFGVAGGSGAFVLNSKTGEGYEQPTFTANSYTTYSYIPKRDDIFGGPYTQRLWAQSTSIAYQQDFGNADTRISLNHSGTHFNVPWFDKRIANAYTATVNSGFDITPKFLARVYLQYSKGRDRQDEFRFDDNFFNTHLRLQYELTPWMNISSTVAFQQSRVESTVPSGSKNKDKQLLGNLFLNINKKIGQHFTLSPYIGIQSSKQKFSSLANSGLSAYYQKYTGTAWLGGVNTNLSDVWFTSFTYRSDDFTVLPSSTDQSTVSFSTALDFSRLLDIAGRTFSYGKIRGAVGSSGVQFPQLYPFYMTSQQTPVNVSGTKTSWEAGADLAFFQSRVGLSATYFHDLMEDVFSNGFPVPMYFDLEAKGFELVLKATPISATDFTWYTSVVWGKTDTNVVAPGETNPSPVVIADFNPDYNYSFLSQMSWKKWNFNFLLDGRKGGSYLKDMGMDFQVEDASFLKLRDISLGYDFQLRGRGISALTVSVVGRNLSMISSKSGDDPEEFNSFTTFNKSVSLNIGMQF